jgi:hypothetical protein
LLHFLRAFPVHGYHPYVEDAEIYVPGIKASTLRFTPYNRRSSVARAPVVAFKYCRASYRVYLRSIVLLGCVCRICISVCLLEDREARVFSPLAAWGGVALVASLLTIPVAGTALYIMDQYLTARSFSAATVLMMVASAAERRYGRAGVWAVLTAVVHPLMVGFGVSYAVLLMWFRRKTTRAITALHHRTLPFDCPSFTPDHRPRKPVHLLH